MDNPRYLKRIEFGLNCDEIIVTSSNEFSVNILSFLSKYFAEMM